MTSRTTQTLRPRQSTAETLFHQEVMNDLKLDDRGYYRYPKRNRKTIDRPNIMGPIKSLLEQEGVDSTHVAILYGMGGQGKTMLVENYCR